MLGSITSEMTDIDGPKPGAVFGVLTGVVPGRSGDVPNVGDALAGWLLAGGAVSGCDACADMADALASVANAVRMARGACIVHDHSPDRFDGSSCVISSVVRGCQYLAWQSLPTGPIER